MVDATPIVPTLAAVYMTSGTTGALSNEAMNEVNMTSLGYPRYTVYEITDAAKRYLDRDTVPVFEVQAGGIGGWTPTTGTVEYAGGRVIFATPKGSADNIRCASGDYFTTITKVMGASVSKLTTGPTLVEVPLLGDAYVRRYPVLKDFSLSVDAFLVLTQAEYTTTAGGANANLKFKHVAGGTAGNTYTVDVNDPGGDGSLTVSVAGTATTITLAYASGAVTSTALQVMSAVNSSPECKAIGLIAELPSGSTGAGLMVDEGGAALLAGGLDYNDFEDLYGDPLIIMMYVNTSSDIRMEGYGYIETEDWSFDPKNVIMETINFKGDGPLYYRPA